MKKINLSLFILLITTCLGGLNSCGKDDEGDAITIAFDSSKYFSSLNVTNAKSLYKQSDTSISASYVDTRSSNIVTNDTYWKIDNNGDSVQLCFTGEDGTNADISIDNIYKLGSRLLYVVPNPSDLVRLSVFDVCYCIVDTETGKIYDSPKTFDTHFWGETGDCRDLTCYESENGDVYFKASVGGDEYSIYKIDINDFTLTEIVNLSNHLIFSYFTSFELLDGGYLYMNGYYNATYYHDNYILTPSNSLISLKECSNLFTIGGELFYNAYEFDGDYGNYSSEKSTIYRIITGNTYNEEVVITTDADNDSQVFVTYGQYNPLKGCWLFHDLIEWHENQKLVYYEFDGANMNKVDTITYGDTISSSNEQLTTSDSWWWMGAEGIIAKVSMNDYSTTTIDVSRGSYLVTSASASGNSSTIYFTALQYSDQATIIGMIDSENNITTTTTQASGQEIVDLIPLN